MCADINKYKMEDCRDRLLNDKLKRYYDVLVKQSEQYIPDNKIKNFKNQLSKNLNGAFRFGKHNLNER